MGEIVNLRRVRKARERAAQKAAAASARLVHGENSDVAAGRRRGTALHLSLVDGAKIDRCEPDQSEGV